MSFIVILKLSLLASLPQSHDPSEIIQIFWFAAKKNIYYNNVENSWVDCFRFLWWIERSEEQHLSEIEIFCIIVNVLIITFDQFKSGVTKFGPGGPVSCRV